jgi:hypothetical protein
MSRVQCAQDAPDASPHRSPIETLGTVWAPLGLARIATFVCQLLSFKTSTLPVSKKLKKLVACHGLVLSLQWRQECKASGRSLGLSPDLSMSNASAGECVKSLPDAFLTVWWGGEGLGLRSFVPEEYAAGRSWSSTVWQSGSAQRAQKSDNTGMRHRVVIQVDSVRKVNREPPWTPEYVVFVS